MIDHCSFPLPPSRVDDRVGRVQYFKENPYFTNSVLKKEYKYIPPPAASSDKADEDGITEAMVEFSWERDVDPQVRVYIHCG